MCPEAGARWGGGPTGILLHRCIVTQLLVIDEEQVNVAPAYILYYRCGTLHLYVDAP